MAHKPTPSSFDITWRGLPLSGTATFYPGREGRFSGPPEKCYPSEPDEVEVDVLTCEGKDALFLLESNLSEEIGEAIAESFHVEPDYPEFEPEEDE